MSIEEILVLTRKQLDDTIEKAKKKEIKIAQQQLLNSNPVNSNNNNNNNNNPPNPQYQEDKNVDAWSDLGRRLQSTLWVRTYSGVSTINLVIV